MARVSNRSGPAKDNRGALAFGRNLMVLGALILCFGGWAAVQGALTLRWPRAEASITSASLLRQSAASARRVNGHSTEDSWNSFHVLYTYRVGGIEYVSGGVEPYDLGMQNSAGAARMRERYPVGSKAMIAYDPGAPATAYLEPGPSSFSLALVGVGTAIALAGAWGRRKAGQGIGVMNRPGVTEERED